jgi:hypothetical protein
MGLPVQGYVLVVHILTVKMEVLFACPYATPQSAQIPKQEQHQLGVFMFSMTTGLVLCMLTFYIKVIVFFLCV